MAAFTPSAPQRRQEPKLLQEEVIQRIRIERIKQAQDKEIWIYHLKLCLKGGLTVLSVAEVGTTTLVAPGYEVNKDGLLFFCSRSNSMKDKS